MVSLKMVIDASILISFDERGLFDNLLAFLEKRISEGYKIILPSETINECGTLKYKIRRIKELTEDKSINQRLFDDLKKKAGDLKIHLHSKNDNDFRLLACAIENDVNYLISNDRQMVRFLSRYKSINQKSKTVEILSLANFLRFIRSIDATFFGVNANKNYAEANLQFYSKCETKGFCELIGFSMWNQIQTGRASNQHEVQDFMSTWTDQIEDVFKPYGENVLEML